MTQSLIDLRSDTVTRPGKEMLEAMMSAKIGDDVFDEDPTVKELENKAAKLFGQEAGLFCPSGTMTNQIGIRILTQPQQEIICDKFAHIFYYEGGGIASNSGVSMRLVNCDRGILTPGLIEENINPPDNIHQPFTSVVSLENTSNKGGGSYYSLEQISAIATTVRKHNLKFHLDGARIFNALAETGDTPKSTGELFDTVSVCLSKGLGAPVGSLLLSTKENIFKAKRVRKSFGGGMRQSGFLAAAGIYALDNNIERLKEDHSRARTIENELKKLSYIEEIVPVETNIIIFKLDRKFTTNHFLNYLNDHSIKCVEFGKNTIRFVTHLDINDSMIDRLIQTLKKY